MGYRNRMLGGLEDAIRFATEARDLMAEMNRNDCHDGGETQTWRLKGHAVDAFWKWVCSWAVTLRKPSDLGHDDGALILPPLEEERRQHFDARHDAKPDTDEAVRATIDALGALHHVLSEWYDSTSPVPKSTLGPDEEG